MNILQKNFGILIKKKIRSTNVLLSLFSFLYNLLNVIRVRCVQGNDLRYSKAFLRKTTIRIKNSHNNLILMDGSYLERCSICIRGMYNTISVGRNCHLTDMEFYIEDDENCISIGENTTVGGKTHLACIEGTKIIIGDNCMLSKDIVFRTGDSHSIIDQSGRRINNSQDIIIGNHVWFGNKTTVLKGVKILDNSIVAAGSIVTDAISKSNVIIAGIPARIVKENINWLRERI